MTIFVDEDTEEAVRTNRIPNSARFLRPIYLIREKETSEDFLNEVVHNTDEARNDLNLNGLIVGNEKVDINDTMKDLKFKKWICGLGGARVRLNSKRAYAGF